MKTPNQIDRQRDDVQPDAEALLLVSALFSVIASSWACIC